MRPCSWTTDRMTEEGKLLAHLRTRACAQRISPEEKKAWDIIQGVGIPAQSLDPIAAPRTGDEKEQQLHSVLTTVRGYLDALTRAAGAAIAGPRSGQNEERLVSLCSAMNGLAKIETLYPVDFPPFVCHRIINQLAKPIRINHATGERLDVLRHVVDVGNAGGGGALCWYTRTVACAVLSLAEMEVREANVPPSLRRMKVCVEGSFGGPLEAWLALRRSAQFADAPIAFQPRTQDGIAAWRRTMQEVSSEQRQRAAPERPAKKVPRTARMLSGQDPDETESDSERTVSDTEIPVEPILNRKTVGRARKSAGGMFSRREPDDDDEKERGTAGNPITLDD